MPVIHLNPEFQVCCQVPDCFGDADIYRKGKDHPGEENTGYLLCRYHALKNGFCWDCGEWFEFQPTSLNQDHQSVNYGRCKDCEELFNVVSQMSLSEFSNALKTDEDS